MPKFKVTVVFTGEVELEIEADTAAEAEILASGDAFDDVSPMDLERNILDLSAKAEEIDEEDEELEEDDLR